MSSNPAAAPTASCKPLLGPTLAVLCSMIAGLAIYQNMWKLAAPPVHRPIAHVAAIVAFISIGFGTLLIYPIGRARRAPLGAVIAACLVTPILWNIKEMVRVLQFFTPAEALWWGLNPAFLLTFIGAWGQMGLCELLYRARRRAAGAPVRVVTPAPVLGIGLALIALYMLLIWGGGVHTFYLYMEAYRALFS